VLFWPAQLTVRGNHTCAIESHLAIRLLDHSETTKITSPLLFFPNQLTKAQHQSKHPPGYDQSETKNCTATMTIEDVPQQNMNGQDIASAPNGELANGDLEQPQLPVEEEQPNSDKPFFVFSEAFWFRVIALFVHCCFVALSVLTHFIDNWSGDAEATFWIAASSESVFQHLKMMLWPWLLLLFPLDLLARRYVVRSGGVRVPKTWYCRCISKSSWLSLCLATTVAMLSAMLFIAVVYAILYYAGSESLTVDVILFLIAIIGGAFLRLFLMRRETMVMWAAFAYLLGGTIWFFTYFSYKNSDDLYTGYWFNPDPYNVTHADDDE
jgi:hypothetical protein